MKIDLLKFSNLKMAFKEFTLCHVFDRGLDGRKFYRFDTSEKLEKFYEQFSAKYHRFTESLFYNENDELDYVRFVTDPSQFNNLY